MRSQVPSLEECKESATHGQNRWGPTLWDSRELRCGGCLAPLGCLGQAITRYLMPFPTLRYFSVALEGNSEAGDDRGLEMYFQSLRARLRLGKSP